MNLRKKLGCALSIIGISLPGFAMAGPYVFFSSVFNSSNGLNITTSSGDFFVPISDSGWWTNSFGHDASNKNYIAGNFNDGQGDYNNYFTFDLSGISGTITTASLNLYTYEVVGSSIDYQLFDVTSPLSEVHATGTNAAVYNDLMTGVSYGSFIYHISDRNDFRSILLNADGISALNSAIGDEFGIGGTVSPIPEPETYAMWLAGLGLLGFFGYRRKAKTSIYSSAHYMTH